MANLPDKRVHHGIVVFSTRLSQHDKAGSSFHQRGDVAIFGTTQQISLPAALHSAILYLGGPAPDWASIDSLALGLPRCAGFLALPHGPAVTQMSHQFFFQRAAGLNERTFVNRFVADMYSLVSVMRGPEPTRYLLR